MAGRAGLVCGYPGDTCDRESAFGTYEVRFCFDRYHLYLGIRCFDHEPEKIIVKQLQHDGYQDSEVRIVTAHGDPRGNQHNTLVGADLNYLNTRIADDKQLVGHAWSMATDSGSREATDTAFNGDLDWRPSRHVTTGVEMELRHIRLTEGI